MGRGFFYAIFVMLISAVPAKACELKLLLSWDVSASMNEEEFNIQQLGTAEAFRDPAVKNTIALSRGGVAVALMLWAGPDEQSESIPWLLLKSGRDADQFAHLIEQIEHPFETRTGTAIGNGLKQAGQLLAKSPYNCSRTVLDISGDGISNAGIDTSAQADLLERVNVTINGLVLPESVKMAVNDPYMFYVRHIARGRGSFVMDVTSYSDFPRAMRRKLLRELLREVAAVQ